MNILEFLNIDDLKHIQAIDYFENNGKFPEGFVPKDLEDLKGWYWRMHVKLGRRWIKYVLKQEEDRLAQETRILEENPSGNQIYDQSVPTM